MFFASTFYVSVEALFELKKVQIKTLLFNMTFDFLYKSHMILYNFIFKFASSDVACFFIAT
jgi:hypothetical protein